MRIRNALSISMLLAFAASAPALANEGYENFSAWDADRNGYVDASEYDTAFDESGLFGEWDANDDGLLDDNEFSTASSDWGLEDDAFDGWDADDDGFLDEDETSDGVFDSWDGDDNNQVVSTEYDDAGDRGWFDW